MTQDILWKTKLAARLHDPAEKALVLLRDPAGHEGGTSRALTRLLGLDSIDGESIDPDNDQALASPLFGTGLPRSIYRHVQRADWWAAGADRPQWPMQSITVTTRQGEQKTIAVAPWAQVRWTRRPVLIHPLTGAQFDLGTSGGLAETDLADLKQRSFDHFAGLLAVLGAGQSISQDQRKTLLTLWRFGPELRESEDNGKLGALWHLLPADTRIPDHSIWDHLDLTSAFAGAFAADPDGEVALLSLSIGPVQTFIAAARSTSDLWAGSHLLSRLAWEAMRPVCEQLGPDAILFPRLRGIPQVDLWLRDTMGLPDALFDDCNWNKGATDANPLFSAALPNRFVAVVPAGRARQIAEAVEQSVRQWLRRLGDDVVSRLLATAGYDVEHVDVPYAQMREQLEGFPEVHWAAVPFSLASPRNETKQTDLDTCALSAAMAPFFGANEGEDCGFLATPAWKILQKELDWRDGTCFFAPKPGVLYPAIYDLAERTLAAAKSVRQFGQRIHEGWRCALTGEAEWLTTDRAQLQHSYRQQTDTLWARVAARKPAWAKNGEHLSALPAIKRLWPTIFAEEVGKALAATEDGASLPVGRFVVSTHTMALAHQLDQWLKRDGPTVAELGAAFSRHGAESVALPRKLATAHAGRPALADAKRLPGLLEAARDASDDTALEQVQSLVRSTLALGTDKDKGEGIRLETYYALIMLDGDRMGAILSGDDANQIRYIDSFHPDVRRGFEQHAEGEPLIRQYGAQQRPVSPNRHLAISGALNDFSQTVVRHVVEEEHLGRVIYAGGDDVLAMLPVSDLLPCAQRLRHAYSGTLPEDKTGDWGDLRRTRGTLHCRNGFAWLDGRLMRMMGEHATASCGAVIAHHQAPLGAVLGELRTAEQRAKNEGGRDAFSLTVIKRSGGALHLTAKWGDAIVVLEALIDYLRASGVSRRAVYNTLEWLVDLPDPGSEPQLLEALLAYQLARQASNSEDKTKAPQLAARLVQVALRASDTPLPWLQNLLTVGELLARETRAGARS